MIDACIVFGIVALGGLIGFLFGGIMQAVEEYSRMEKEVKHVSGRGKK